MAPQYGVTALDVVRNYSENYVLHNELLGLVNTLVYNFGDDSISEARAADFAVEIDGHSMEPDYNDGDIVYIALANDVEIGQVGLFMQKGKGFIKEKGDSYLISRNPNYDDIYPDDGEITCIGRVIGVAELP